MFILKNEGRLTPFVLLISFLNFLLYHFPFYTFVLANVEYRSFNGILLLVSLVVLMIIVNAFVFYLLISMSTRLGKFLLALFFMLNALAIYFVHTYSVIIDESMISNVINTNYEESSSFFSWKLLVYLLLFGLVPSVIIMKCKLRKDTPKKFVLTSVLTLLFIGVSIFVNASNWLWIDKYSKQLGGLAMPWSYTVNVCRYYIHDYQQNKKEILLPDATVNDNEKSVVVLVIGESARSQNFSLYGYGRNTNPLLAKTENLFTLHANSCATYTTAAIKCILEHTNSNELYEILPNYLYRNNIEVIWRSTNSGEPPIHIKNYQKGEELITNCEGEGCAFDEVLLTGLNEQIRASTSHKVLVVLHTSTSHGPSYNKKYPKQFETFGPVCNSVELSECT